MSPIEAVLLVAVLALPLHGLVLWQIGRLEDPAYLREHGIVIVREEVLEKHSPPIGEFQGCGIWGTVTFMGLVYRFDRIARPQEKEKLGRGELYIEPGIIYLID